MTNYRHLINQNISTKWLYPSQQQTSSNIRKDDSHVTVALLHWQQPAPMCAITDFFATLSYVLLNGTPCVHLSPPPPRYTDRTRRVCRPEKQKKATRKQPIHSKQFFQSVFSFTEGYFEEEYRTTRIENAKSKTPPHTNKIPSSGVL